MNVNLKLSGRVEVAPVPASGAGTPATQADLRALGDMIVSALSDKINAANAAADQAVARVQADVTTLNGKIDALQKQVDQGTATQADLDALDALRAKVDAIDPTSSSTLGDAGAGTNAPATGTDSGTASGTAAPGGATLGGAAAPDQGTAAAPDPGQAPPATPPGTTTI